MFDCLKACFSGAERSRPAAVVAVPRAETSGVVANVEAAKSESTQRPESDCLRSSTSALSLTAASKDGSCQPPPLVSPSSPERSRSDEVGSSAPFGDEPLVTSVRSLPVKLTTTNTEGDAVRSEDESPVDPKLFGLIMSDRLSDVASREPNGCPNTLIVGTPRQTDRTLSSVLSDVDPKIRWMNEHLKVQQQVRQNSERAADEGSQPEGPTGREAPSLEEELIFSMDDLV